MDRREVLVITLSLVLEKVLQNLQQCVDVFSITFEREPGYNIVETMLKILDMPRWEMIVTFSMSSVVVNIT